MQGVRWVFALLAVLVMAGCGGSDKKYYVPVDSPAKPFMPPESDDLIESDGDDWAVDEDEGEGEGEGEGDDTDADGDAAGEAEPKPEPPKTRAAPPRPTQPAPGSAPPPPKPKK